MKHYSNLKNTCYYFLGIDQKTMMSVYQHFLDPFSTFVAMLKKIHVSGHHITSRVHVTAKGRIMFIFIKDVQMGLT